MDSSGWGTREFFTKLITAKEIVSVELINGDNLELILENISCITRNTGKEIIALKGKTTGKKTVVILMSSIESINVSQKQYNGMKELYKWDLSMFLEKQIKTKRLLNIKMFSGCSQSVYITDVSFYYKRDKKGNPYKEITMLKCLTPDKKVIKCVPIDKVMYFIK